MRKITGYLLAGLTLLSSVNISALEGEMGYFGGITPGKKLPTNTQLAQAKVKTGKYTLPYKETLYLTGKPIVVEGTIDLNPVTIDKEKPTGTYKESYVIKAEDPTTDSSLTRNVILETTYLYDPLMDQTTKTSEITKWTELVKINGQTYQLDENASYFSKSLLEDYTPGVMYYSGDVVYQAVYRNPNDPQSPLTVDVVSEIYGYDHAYAKTETQKRTIQIDTGTQQFYIEETPTFTTNKELQYSSNAPEAMSFEGNYREITRGEGAVMYQIVQGSEELYDSELQGAINVVDTPSIEQLPSIDLSHIKGHPAEWDAKKLYSLGIFEGNPKAFSTNLAVTREDYMRMLIEMMQIPVEEEIEVDEFFFNPFIDLPLDDPFYPYALAAYNAGLVSSGRVGAGDYIKREEAYSLAVKAIGLEKVGINANHLATPFIDDANISAHFKNTVYAASKIGLIPFSNGYFLPQSEMKYMDVAVLLNSLMDYIRYDLQKDYNEKMMY